MVFSVCFLKKFKPIMKINLLKYCSRYLSGGESITTLRTVNRRRFSLAFAGAHIEDIEAYTLARQTKSFIDGVAKLNSSKFITIRDLNCVNGMVASSNKLCGKVRTFQNWVGESLDNPEYLPPPYSDLPELIGDYLNSLNAEVEFNDVYLLIFYYAKFILIHPYADGNGRTARAIFLSKMYAQGINEIPQLMFRFIQKSGQHHDEAVRSFLLGDHYNDYWHDMINWSVEKNSVLKNEISDTESEYFNKFYLYNISKEQSVFLDKLLNESVVVFECIDSVSKEIKEILDMGIDRSIINIKGVSRWSKQVIIDSEYATYMHDKLEKKIFQKESF